MATKTYAGVTHTVVQRQGYWLDQRTADFFDSVNKAMPGGVKIIQGPFNKSVDASAGTHDGPGALDLKPVDQKYKNVAGYKMLETICRQRGGASWFREWTNNFHVHVIVIGTKGLPTVAAKQVTSYLNSRDGLKSNRTITGVIKTTWEKFKAALTKPKPQPAPVGVNHNTGLATERPFGPCPLRSKKGFDMKTFAYGPSTPGRPWFSGKFDADKRAVKQIQRMVGTVADGIYGPNTVAAVKKWQTKHKYTPNGIVTAWTWDNMTRIP